MAIYNPQRGVYTDTPDSAGAVPIQPPPSAPPNPATAAALPPSAPTSLRVEGGSGPNPNYPTPQFNTPSPGYPTSAPPASAPAPSPVAGAMKLGANSYGDGTMTNTAMPTPPTVPAVTTPPPPPVPSVTPPTTAGALANGAAPMTPQQIEAAAAPAAPASTLPTGLQLTTKTPATAGIAHPENTANPNYPAPVFNQAPASYPQPAPFNPQQVASGATTVAAPPPSLRAPVAGEDIDPATGQPRRTMDNAVPNPSIKLDTSGTNLFAGANPAQYAPGGGYTRTGNSYSDGSTSMPGDLSPEQRAALGVKNTGVGYIGGGVSSAERIAQMQRDSAHIKDMTSLRLAHEQAMGGHGSGVMDQQTADNARREKFFEDAALHNAAMKGSWSPRGGYKSDEGAIQAALAPIQNRAKLAEMSLKNQGDLRSAQLQAETARRGQDITAGTARAEQGVQMYGHNVAAQGHQLTYGAAQAKNQYEAAKADRQFGFEKEKFGVETAQKNLEQRQAADKALTEEAMTRFRKSGGVLGKDEPDMERVAEYKQAINDHLAGIVQQLSAIPPGHPNYAAAQKKIEDIGIKGPAAVDNADKAKIETLLQAKKTAMDFHSRINPWMGTASDSPNVSDYTITGLQEGATQNQYVSKAGLTPTRALDYTGGGNKIIPNALGDTRTNRYASIMKPDMTTKEGKALAKKLHDEGYPGY